jgi:hypothetical protein
MFLFGVAMMLTGNWCWLTFRTIRGWSFGHGISLASFISQGRFGCGGDGGY